MGDMEVGDVLTDILPLILTLAVFGMVIRMMNKLSKSMEAD